MILHRMYVVGSERLRLISPYVRVRLGIEASAVVCLLADLAQILDRYGNRGYGAAQLEAGIVGGKMYLCAYALGLGATGTTFYDDDVTAFFSPHAAGKVTLFAIALGRRRMSYGASSFCRQGLLSCHLTVTDWVPVRRGGTSD